jgi:hypothetical protein
MRTERKSGAEGEIREYLLGSLSETRKEALEEQYLTDARSLERIEMVEDELIDDYLEGRLTPDERLKFQQVFLTIDTRNEKLRLARALRKRVAGKTGILDRISERFHVPVQAIVRVGLVAIPVLLLLSCGLGWLLVREIGQGQSLRTERQDWMDRETELQERLSQAEDALASQASDDAEKSELDAAEQNELSERLRRAEETNRRLQAEVRRLESRKAPPPAASPSSSVRLRADGVRSGEIPTASLAAQALLLEFQLELPAKASAYQSFQAQLLRVDRRNQVVQNSLLQRRPGESTLLRFPVGSGLLQSGEYSVQLGGFTRAGALQELDRYRVQVSR